MKKLFLILLGASALSFQACKSGTADQDKVIDDGMSTSETSFGSGSTRPADRNPDTSTTEANNAGRNDNQDTTKIETGTMPDADEKIETEKPK